MPQSCKCLRAREAVLRCPHNCLYGLCYPCCIPAGAKRAATRKAVEHVGEGEYAYEPAVSWCLIGAHNHYAYGTPEVTRTKGNFGDLLWDVIHEKFPRALGIAEFNDNLCTSQSVAVTLMEEVEKRYGITSAYRIKADPLFYGVCLNCFTKLKWEGPDNEQYWGSVCECGYSYSRYFGKPEIINAYDEAGVEVGV